MKKWFARMLHRFYERYEFEQRKQFATACNTIAAIILVQFTFQQKGYSGIWGVLIALSLWLIAVEMVRKEK